MSNQWKPVMLSIALAASCPAYASDITNTQVKQTRPDSLSIEANTLSESEWARARLWGLSETEWRRYQQLMQGIRGSISPSTISPIEVLGIHARDEAERQRYAEAWARTMYQDAGRILAFQHAYDAAVKRLYPNEPLIDISRLPAKTEEMHAFLPTDRMLFFTRPECPICDLMLNNLLKRIDEVSGIDIYLSGVGQGDDSGVRAWASRHQIDPEWVRNRRITLNHDGGALDKLTNGEGEVPYLLRRRGEELSPIRVSDL